MNFCFSISTYVEFIDSSRSESYHCWKGSIIALPVHSKSSGSFQLWSGQSHSLSKKSGKEKEATQWVAQPAGRPTMQHNCQVHSVFSLRGRINLNFFFPLCIHLFSYLDSILLNSLPSLSHFYEICYRTPQLLAEVSREVKTWTKSMTGQILSNQV